MDRLVDLHVAANGVAYGSGTDVGSDDVFPAVCPSICRGPLVKAFAPIVRFGESQVLCDVGRAAVHGLPFARRFDQIAVTLCSTSSW